jgi:ubiquinol-cytochrome c reductase cytochrome c subunit
VSWITARRRHPAASYALVVAALAIVGVGYAVLTTSGSANASQQATANSAQVVEGHTLFEQTCSSCHGVFAQGTTNVAPSLIGVGGAAVDFQLSTGRMPLTALTSEAERKPPKFDPAQIAAIDAYIQSLGGGPAVPTAAEVNPAAGNYALGQQLFEANCAACHNFVGAGGALTNGAFAPSLTQSTPKQMYEAMLTGPEAMPVFNDLIITPQEKRDIIAFVTQVRSQPNPGGLSLGRIGPVTEGLVAFLGLLLFLVLAALWITAKHGKAHE